MFLTHQAELDLPFYLEAVRQVHIVPDLAHTNSRISISQLCNAGWDVVFGATTVTVRYNHQTVLTGQHTQATRLWYLQPTTAPTAQTNAAVGSATPQLNLWPSRTLPYSPWSFQLELVHSRKSISLISLLSRKDSSASTHHNCMP
jgi:hypothetical protein